MNDKAVLTGKEVERISEKVVRRVVTMLDGFTTFEIRFLLPIHMAKDTPAWVWSVYSKDYTRDGRVPSLTEKQRALVYKKLEKALVDRNERARSIMAKDPPPPSVEETATSWRLAMRKSVSGDIPFGCP